MKYIFNLFYTALLVFTSIYYSFNHNIPACIAYAIAALYYILFKIEVSKSK